MMSPGISIKELILPTIGIIIYLIFIFIVSNFIHPTRLYVCDENGSLEAYIVDQDYEYLLYPKDMKNLQECLGKGMRFYDRSIEYILGPVTMNLRERLGFKYKINHTIPNLHFSLNNIKIEMNSNNISIFTENNRIGIVRNKKGMKTTSEEIFILPYGVSILNVSNKKKTFELNDGEFMVINL